MSHPSFHERVVRRLSITFVFAFAVGMYAGCNCEPSPPPAGTDGGVTDGGTTDGSTTGGTTGTTSGTTTGTTTSTTTGTTTGGTTGACQQVLCGGSAALCGNCLDDDGDGLIDDQDPNCLGPCHNKEDSFLWGYAPADQGGGGQCARDCYYDGNASQSSTDGCKYNLKCDPLTPDPNCPYTIKCSDNTSSCNNGCVGDSSCNAECPNPQPDSRCASVCLDQLTPRGCDCFGCCTIYKNGTGYDVYLRSDNITGNGSDSTVGNECNFANVDNPAICKQCTKNLSCNKTCGTCQLCLGKTEQDLQNEGCSTGGTSGGTTGSQQCPDGKQPCGLSGQADCPAGFFCLTGCCVSGLN